MDYNKYRKQNQEIDLLQLLLVMLTKWRILILSILIGAIIGAGYTGVKQIMATNASKVGNSDTSTVDADSLSIDESKIRDMKIARNYYDVIKSEEEWLENSPLANMNSDSLYRGVIRYSISGEESDNIAGIYKHLICTREFQNVVNDSGLFEYDIKYLGEVVGAFVGTEEDVNITGDMNGVDSATGTIYAVKTSQETYKDEDDKNKLITYTFCVDDEDAVTSIMDLVDDYVIQYTNGYLNDSNYSIVKIGEFVEPYIRDYSSVVDTHLNNKYKASTNYDTLVKKFSDIEKKYFQERYLGYEANKNSDSIGLSDYGKNVLICALVVLFISMGIIACRFIFDGRIKNINELRIYRAPIYGINRGVESTSKLDNWFKQRLLTYSGLELSRDYTLKSLELLDISDVVIYNMAGVVEGDALVNPNFWSGIRTVCVMDEGCSSDERALARGKELKNEIIVVKLFDSKSKDILAEMETAYLQDISVVGIICV